MRSLLTWVLAVGVATLAAAPSKACHSPWAWGWCPPPACCPPPWAWQPPIFACYPQFVPYAAYPCGPSYIQRFRAPTPEPTDPPVPTDPAGPKPPPMPPPEPEPELPEPLKKGDATGMLRGGKAAIDVAGFSETKRDGEGFARTAAGDPGQGRRLYGAGLSHYFGKRYAAAEEAFKDAVKNDGRDARYRYFLGLSRLALGNREGYGDFDQGAALERAGLPGKAAVATSLERVQGEVRRVLNEARYKTR